MHGFSFSLSYDAVQNKILVAFFAIVPIPITVEQSSADFDWVVAIFALMLHNIIMTNKYINVKSTKISI